MLFTGGTYAWMMSRRNRALGGIGETRVYG